MAKEKLQSEVTGAVVSIDVGVGARVSAGDTVLVLESMKMEMPVTAPCDGVITEILVETSQSVDEGQTVAVLER